MKHDPILAQWEKRQIGLTMTKVKANPNKRAYQLWYDSLDDLEIHKLQKDWWFLARDEQLPPPGDWAYWLYLAGRGAGKTRTGAEWTRDLIKQGYRRGGLIAPTAADARDVMIEGESGLLACCDKYDQTYDGVHMGKPLYEPSKRRVTWENGAMVTLFSADEPERLRGPQHEFIWADEIVAWRRPETWDLAMFGLRLPTRPPKAFISTTPKPKKLILDLMKDPSTAMTRGSTYSNRANLAKKFFDQIVTKFEGTRLGQQELMGVVLEEAEGALWSRDMIDRTRVPCIPLDENFYFLRIVVAVDPAITAHAESDETGIVVVGLGNDKHAYILADVSGTMMPGAWAKKAVDTAVLWQADAIVAEGNQGGEMVRHTIQTEIDSRNSKGHGVVSLPVQIVHASRGKAARAEPISALHEQGKVHFVGSKMSELEDQLCVWEPLSGEGSPDRLDAMVWGVTACILGKGVTDSGKLKGFY